MLVQQFSLDVGAADGVGHGFLRRCRLGLTLLSAKRWLSTKRWHGASLENLWNQFDGFGRTVSVTALAVVRSQLIVSPINNQGN